MIKYRNFTSFESRSSSCSLYWVNIYSPLKTPHNSHYPPSCPHHEKSSLIVSTPATLCCLWSPLAWLSSTTVPIPPCSHGLCPDPIETRWKGIHALLPEHFRAHCPSHPSCDALSRYSLGSRPCTDHEEGTEGPQMAGMGDGGEKGHCLGANNAKPFGFLSAGDRENIFWQTPFHDK